MINVLEVNDAAGSSSLLVLLVLVMMGSKSEIVSSGKYAGSKLRTKSWASGGSEATLHTSQIKLASNQTDCPLT